MATIEERVQALEQEIAVRKHAEEMLTIAVRALVSKEAFEKLQETIEEAQEQNGKLFNVLINQGTLHNERITDLQGQIIDLGGSVKRLQAEMRETRAELTKRTTNLQGQITDLDGTVKDLQTEMRETRAQITDLDGTVKDLQTEMRETRGDITDLKSIARQILSRLPGEP